MQKMYGNVYVYYMGNPYTFCYISDYIVKIMGYRLAYQG